MDPSLVLITDVSLCETIVKKVHRDECKSIFLILSGLVANELLNLLTPDVHTVFIFCFNQTKYLDLKSRSKIDIICDSPSILIERITYCLDSIKRLYAYEHEQQSVRNLSKETAAFIWFHILRNVVRHFEKSPQAKNDMMEHFREYYQGNPAQSKRLVEFAETYESDHTLWWYTQASFISDIINKTLRARDIDGLFSLRYCIVDLCQLLDELPRLTEHLTVHRAMLMDRDKFEQMKEHMNKGDLVSTRGFLSTSRDRKMAEKFGFNDSGDPNKVEIIYEIDVPVGLKRIVCGDISIYSQFQEEKEILFDLDSSFEFVEVLEDPDKTDRWIIRLEANDRGALLADKYVTDSNRELTESSAEILFGKLLINMGDAAQAIKYFQQLLSQSNGSQKYELTVLSRINRGLAMNNIGHAWYQKGDYQRALQWFDSALALQQQEPALPYHIAMTMNNKGVLLMMAGK
ncbi:unnamed protein product [Rotaria sp. Silwood2]|nr:unnamed protein product [Rotaria sp. Silwood2]